MATETKPNCSGSALEADAPVLDDQTVVSFLEQNPDFFERCPDALAGLHLHHDSGGAVSLIERQVRHLRDRNRTFRQQFDGLLTNARENESRVEHLNELAQRLIGSDSLESVARGVRATLARSFQVEGVFLGIRGSAPDGTGPNGPRFIAPKSQLLKVFRSFFREGRPQCGPLSEETSALLFPECHAPLRSAAMVPLDRDADMGLLVLAGADPERFTADMGTWFLEMTADLVTSACRIYLPE